MELEKCSRNVTLQFENKYVKSFVKREYFYNTIFNFACANDNENYFA